MNWTELIDEVSGRTHLSKTKVKRVLDAMSDECVEALGRGESVSLRDLGRLEVKEVKPRAIRRIDDKRKYYVGRRHKVRFRPAAAARRAATSLSPEHWRDPAHQAAWRHAETLISDLDLYHGAKAPTLSESDSLEDASVVLQSTFGHLWDRVRRAYDAEIPSEVRAKSDYLVEAARRRWAS